jgi:hypothetical protein
LGLIDELHDKLSNMRLLQLTKAVTGGESSVTFSIPTFRKGDVRRYGDGAQLGGVLGFSEFID